MRAHHKHWVASAAPVVPDLFEPERQRWFVDPRCEMASDGFIARHAVRCKCGWQPAKGPLFTNRPLGGGNAPVGTEPDNAPPSVAVDTSREAAARIKPHTARVREAIYLFIRATGGATAGEISEKLGLNPSTVRPRLLELQGLAKWAPGLPARIQRSPDKRGGMRIYVAGVAPRHSGTE